MLARFQRVGLVWPTIFTIIGLFVLVSLGTWQLQRMAFKERLISDIETRARGPAMTLAEVQVRSAKSGVTAVDYQRVKLKGRFLHDKERFLFFHKRELGSGYDVYTPLTVAPNKVVWVNRGFVSETMRSPDKREAGQISGEVQVEGRVRLAQDPGFFTPANQMEKNMWFWRDLEGMHASAFSDTDVVFIPFFVEAGTSNEFAPRRGNVSAGNGSEGPVPGASVVKIFNRHFEYALTWYGLALTLLCVYLAFGVGKWRKVQD